MEEEQPNTLINGLATALLASPGNLRCAGVLGAAVICAADEERGWLLMEYARAHSVARSLRRVQSRQAALGAS
jgi:hypothetical protein